MTPTDDPKQHDFTRGPGEDDLCQLCGRPREEHRPERPRAATVDLSALTGGYPAFEYLGLYVDAVLELAGEAEEVVLTGEAPAWLFLAVSNALRGQGKKVSLGPGAAVDLDAGRKDERGEKYDEN